MWAEVCIEHDQPCACNVIPADSGFWTEVLIFDQTDPVKTEKAAQRVGRGRGRGRRLLKPTLLPTSPADWVTSSADADARSSDREDNGACVTRMGRGRGRRPLKTKPGMVSPADVASPVPDRPTAVYKAAVDQFCDANDDFVHSIEKPTLLPTSPANWVTSSADADARSSDREDTSSQAFVKRMGRGRGRRPLKAGDTKPGMASPAHVSSPVPDHRDTSPEACVQHRPWLKRRSDAAMWAQVCVQWRREELSELI